MVQIYNPKKLQLFSNLKRNCYSPLIQTSRAKCRIELIIFFFTVVLILLCSFMLKLQVCFEEWAVLIYTRHNSTGTLFSITGNFKSWRNAHTFKPLKCSCFSACKICTVPLTSRSLDEVISRPKVQLNPNDLHAWLCFMADFNTKA